MESRGEISDAVFGQCIKRLNRACTAVGGAPFVDRKQLDRRGAPREVTQHGIARATYKTWTQTALNERGAPFNVDAVELSLHHKRIGAGGLGGAYEREDFIKERREIAEAWAVFVFFRGGRISKAKDFRKIKSSDKSDKSDKSLSIPSPYRVSICHSLVTKWAHLSHTHGHTPPAVCF